MTSPNKQPSGQISSTLQQTPTTPNPSPPEEGGTYSPLAIPDDPLPQNPHHAAASSGPRGSSNTPPPRQRSWERVQGHLNEIRKIAETFGNSQGEAIARTAEIALVDLLVDTPTAEALDQTGGSQPSQPPNSVTAAAQSAAQALSNIGRQQLAEGSASCVPYAMIAPHVALLLQWLDTLQTGDISVHIQLPPVLTPFREVLNHILNGDALPPEMWAKLVAVGEALQSLIEGGTLAHPADVVSQAGGAADSALMQTAAEIPQWYRTLEILRGMLNEARTWPVSVLPTMQQAALNLVSAIAAVTPEQEQSGPGDWRPPDWWYTERHHGLGDAARHSTPPSPRGRGTRRARSPSAGNSSDVSHRRRRLLAEHVHGHGI